ncbi:MAG: hypothetical protein DRR08_12415 [Candidatus Parabeggiatoa sp. nov. 2]|nr:MAG: hypothetical protein B6247_04200 [Beggiatoa sp. 4572_84]RKZ60035.1 MAG: hypothetical protein DRR08_12415 [Gammaproteobacteria bacterium]
MQYPLTEKIGNPDLLVGRTKEFQRFGKWLANIPKRLSKSRAILARRKSGKTAFVQRLFNQLWTENGAIIPFYYEFGENKIWYPDLAIKYYCAFASQYISFLERDENLVSERLSLHQLREYGVANSNKLIVDDIDSLFKDKEMGLYDSMWETAYMAPHNFARRFDQRILVILDEFQNITQYIYRDEKCEGKPDETLAGSFHSISESKIAPMLVTGSYVGWLTRVISQYLQAGRLKQIVMSPYLTSEEGLEAVYKYAEFYSEPITNETAVQINELCLSDPFFISCVIQSEYDDKELTTAEGVINTVNYEISDRNSEMSKTWNEYLQSTLQSVNDQYGKSMLLYLNKHADRYLKPRDLKQELSIELSLNQIQKKLVMLSEADLIDRGVSDIRFRGLQDGTLNLIIRNRLQEEILDVVPDFKQEFNDKISKLTAENRQLRGKLNSLSGKMAEHLLALAFRNKKRFFLSDYFQNVTDTTQLNIINVKERVQIQREDGKSMEIDVVAESKCGRVILVEVKKTQDKTGFKILEDFQEKVQVYAKLYPNKTILPACLSLGGFTKDAPSFCELNGIATALEIQHF